MTKRHNFKTLMDRLSRAGFKRDFATLAILPDWWHAECADDESVLPEIELRIARFLGAPLSVVRDPQLPLAAPERPGAQLRRVRDIDRKRIEPAIHTAVSIAGAVVRNLRRPARVRTPPANPLDWRNELERSNRPVTLDVVSRDLWMRGVPIVPIGCLPAPKFQGAVCVVHDRPVVLVGHKNDEPARVAFLVTHEAGHLAAGDCTPDMPVIDEEEISDASDMEQRADRYAQTVLMGVVAVPELEGADFRQLARRALVFERATGAEASAALLAWAVRNDRYPLAIQAIKALYRGVGARKTLRQHFLEHVDFRAASETDRELLRCVDFEPEPLAAAG